MRQGHCCEIMSNTHLMPDCVRQSEHLCRLAPNFRRENQRLGGVQARPSARSDRNQLYLHQFHYHPLLYRTMMTSSLSRGSINGGGWKRTRLLNEVFFPKGSSIFLASAVLDSTHRAVTQRGLAFKSVLVCSRLIRYFV
jgi:hypothetical protein